MIQFLHLIHSTALLDSTQIAGLNCLKLMNELTAIALAYGIYKTDLPESEPLHVMFVDVGDSHTSAGIVAFQKGKLRVCKSLLTKETDREFRTNDLVPFLHYRSSAPPMIEPWEGGTLIEHWQITLPRYSKISIRLI